MLNERDLQVIWYGERKPSLALRVLAGVFGALGAVRRDLYASGLLRRERLPVPVIVVGNISVGGTGKTPLVIALVAALRARGWHPGVISRGYGGSAQRPLLVDAQTPPLVAGDEASLVQRLAQVPVAVGRDRVAGARKLLGTGGIDVLIADDGLQHYRLMRDVEICVIDGARRFGNGRLLPAGPLREPVTRLASVGYRVCNGGIAQSGEIAMTLTGDAAIALGDPQLRRPLREFAGQRVHAVAGIGNPQRFFAQLRAFGLDPIEHPYPDHHPFAAADLEFGDALALLMTEKDAVKCGAFARADRWYVPVRAELAPAFFDALAVRLKRP